MITSTQIKKMKYVDFMALIGETNQSPGGKDSIRILVQNTFLKSNSYVLDVGCNTGFVSFEIANLTNCKVVGIDISEKMINRANQFLLNYYPNLKGRVNFKKIDATKMPFPDNTFDLVVSGGSTAFIKDIPKAIKEYVRVVKPWGFIGDINFYYHTSPPTSLIKKLNELMEIKIRGWGIEYWENNYKKTNLEFFYTYKGIMKPVPRSKILNYVDYLLENKNWSEEVKKVAKKRLIDIYDLFNENHKYLGYCLFILRKRTFEEFTLF